MLPPRYAKLVLHALAIGLVVLAGWVWEPAYWLAMTQKHYDERVWGSDFEHSVHLAPMNGEKVRGWYLPIQRTLENAASVVP